MAGRPRKRGTDAHAEEVARYRARLAERRAPEADDADRALHFAVVKWLQAVRFDTPPGVPGSVMLQVADHLAEAASRRLSKAGYDPEAARAVLERRLHAPLPKDPLGRRNARAGRSPR